MPPVGRPYGRTNDETLDRHSPLCVTTLGIQEPNFRVVEFVSTQCGNVPAVWGNSRHFEAVRDLPRCPPEYGDIPKARHFHWPGYRCSHETTSIRKPAHLMYAKPFRKRQS